MLKSIALFVDEIIVFKIDMMSTNFGRSLIEHINMQSSRSLMYAIKDIKEFEVAVSAWILAFVKMIKTIDLKEIDLDSELQRKISEKSDGMNVIFEEHKSEITAHHQVRYIRIAFQQTNH